MGSERGLGLHLLFTSIVLVATSYTACLGVGNITAVCSEKERLALLKFKKSVQDESNMLSSWVGNDCCQWENIRCNGVTGHVERLHLRIDYGDKLVSNEVNSSLAELRHLKYLDLSGNDFRQSQIPQFIGSLKQLSYLNLSRANFQGNIPHHIGNLSNLKVLDLRKNDVLMSDDMAWTFGLSSLELLDLSYVNLSSAHNWDMVLYISLSLKAVHLHGCGISNVDLGPFLNSSRIPPKIKHLDLGSNSLKSPLPGFFRNMTSLSFLDLSYSNLSLAWNFENFLNMLPSIKEVSLYRCEISNVDLGPFLNSSRILPKIKHLDLGSNSLKSPLPGFFRNMTSLSFLDLSYSNLSLAWNFENFLNMLPSLSELSLSWCGIDNTRLSPFHLNFSTLSIIQHLDLFGNSIGGIFPSVFTNMSSLRVLNLAQNNLNSSVPIMSNLLDLELSHNEFKQIEHVGIFRRCDLKQLRALDNPFDMEMIGLPTNVSECSQYALERLDLGASLIGTIPEPLGRLTNLRSLVLSDCRLTGEIPKSLGTLRFLDVLDLSYNELIGPIPTFLGKLSAIDLSFNRLNGSIPESFGRLATLTFLSLRSNQLTGPIPTSIGQLAKLYLLDISNNLLEGVVSQAHFANLSTLIFLYASFNIKLTFDVSHEWMPPFQLQSLELSSCNITNGLPHWLQNQRKLDILVLSNATIVGPLPTWFREMPIIRFLDLSHNKLTGPLTNLPNNWENVDRYEVGVTALLLLNNIFNESIPRSLCRRSDLDLLDLSKNMLIGKLPDCLKNLHGLGTMIFSSNLLSGVIPSHIGFNCSSLRWLKLNDNNFIGELPRELGNLRDLIVLDVGDNKLFGNIPEGIGENLTSLMVLRLHRNNFTGEIPESLCKM